MATAKALAEQQFLTHSIVSDQCFDACIDNFKISQLDSREDLCVHRCTEKYLNLQQRAGQMFEVYQEHSRIKKLNQQEDQKKRKEFFAQELKN